eukprot:3232138-Amphidinium_carterae.1
MSKDLPGMGLSEFPELPKALHICKGSHMQPPWAFSPSSGSGRATSLSGRVSRPRPSSFAPLTRGSTRCCRRRTQTWKSQPCAHSWHGCAVRIKTACTRWATPSEDILNPT